ncbi:MAG: Gfo/Idh/MocA family oxidoreductase [Chloroflexi bacterium]|nr:MAG: Gfo/Idh/MocA family oxidoreductase [Chloroflexota bacterium]TME42674.1 MAG: Gfo/Idh/MocA family oxidoreductase [Chloroflexota bacterium]TME50967.1 MAG: Gfo/Idh/MocA family oxidoreductase [Chloroflexota bacterium]
MVPAWNSGGGCRRLDQRTGAFRFSGAGHGVQRHGRRAAHASSTRRARLLSQPGRPSGVGRAPCGQCRGRAPDGGGDGSRDPIDRAGRRADQGRDIAARRIGWGILGAAWIAGKAVLPAIDASGNGRIAALASRSPERAGAMLSAYREARLCDSYEQLIEQRDVDAVYIPLVNNLHLEWTLRALDAGKHVLCEKPLGMNAVEAEEMAAAADRAGKRLMEAFMYRFDPRMRDFVEGLHDPLHVNATFGFHLRAPEDYRFQASLGGGALLDVGCYVASVSRWIMGEPIDVMAAARMQGGVDLTTTALLAFDGGRSASLWCSFESPEEQEVTVIARDGVHRRDRPFNLLDDPIGPYRLMVESFADSVLNDRPIAIPLAESIANMKTLDRIREAARF